MLRRLQLTKQKIEEITEEDPIQYEAILRSLEQIKPTVTKDDITHLCSLC